MPRPRINIMIMTQGEPNAPVKSYSLPWYAPRAAVIAGVAVLILLIATSVLFLYYYGNAREVETLRAELKSANAAIAKIGTLQTELQYHRDFTRRVAGLIGISVPNFAESVQVASIIGAGATEMNDTLDGADHGDDEGFGTSGLLVTDCPPDPNNRPRGLPLLGAVSRGFAPHQGNPTLRHTGIDFAVREGTPVLVTADGTVEFVGEDDTYGLLVIVDHGNGFKTTYGHNSLILVKKGEKVQRGERIASSGNTGISTAPHLHYEVSENGEPVDPSGFFGG